MATITAKIKILPTTEDQASLLETMATYSKACNYVSNYIFKTHNLSLVSLHKALYYELRQRFGLRSQMAQSVLKTVVAKYKGILSNEHEWVKPNFKHPEYDLVWNRDYSIKNDKISLNTLVGRIKVSFSKTKMEHFFCGAWKFGTAKLVAKHGKWFLHIPMSREIPTLDDANIANIIGCDFGINFTAVSYSSDGKTSFYSGKAIKHKRAQYSKVRKELQRRGTSSSRRRLKAIGSRENRWMQDVNHQVSKALVNAARANTLFVIEDLTGIRSATEKVRLKNRYVTVSWAFADLRQKLEYKTQFAGSKVIAVDPAYTSQTCPKCGYRHKLSRNKKTHTFCCRKCGYTTNDDRVGAMNLHQKGIEYQNAVIGK